MQSRAVILKKYVVDYPDHTDVELGDYPLEELSEGKILIRLLHLSVDPYMRNCLRPEGSRYIAAFSLNKPIVSLGIGVVIESKNASFQPGDKLIGMLPWQEITVIHPSLVKHLATSPLPLTAHLSILGYTGLTAYVGMYHLVKPQAGQTVFVSSAAGAVGSLAGQLAKLKGCYVVGCAGTDEKIDYLINDLHFDAAFNYSRYTNDYPAALKRFCPQGIDIDFENVGGSLLEAVIECLNIHATIVLCGAISQYNSHVPTRGPKNFYQLIGKQAKLIGYIVNHYDYLFAEYQQFIIEHHQQGKIKYQETIVKGLEHAWEAFNYLFTGKNIGKMLVTI